MAPPFAGRAAAEGRAFGRKEYGVLFFSNKLTGTPECPEGAFRCGECKGSCHACGVTEGLFLGSPV